MKKFILTTLSLSVISCAAMQRENTLDLSRLRNDTSLAVENYLLENDSLAATVSRNVLLERFEKITSLLAKRMDILEKNFKRDEPYTAEADQLQAAIFEEMKLIRCILSDISSFNDFSSLFGTDEMCSFFDSMIIHYEQLHILRMKVCKPWNTVKKNKIDKYVLINSKVERDFQSYADTLVNNSLASTQKIAVGDFFARMRQYSDIC